MDYETPEQMARDLVTQMSDAKAVHRLVRDEFGSAPSRFAIAALRGNFLKNREPRRTTPEQYLNHRLRYLPKQLEAARHKVRALENEARRHGLSHLLENTQ